MIFAEHAATQTKGENGLRDPGRDLHRHASRCIALIPGVSRSGATISAGLLRDLDRRHRDPDVVPARHPGAGRGRRLEAVKDQQGHRATRSAGRRRWSALVVSFVVGYVSIAWLLRFVAKHSIVWFVWYRVALGGLLIAALATGSSPRRNRSTPDAT